VAAALLLPENPTKPTMSTLNSKTLLIRIICSSLIPSHWVNRRSAEVHKSVKKARAYRPRTSGHTLPSATSFAEYLLHHPGGCSSVNGVTGKLVPSLKKHND
jgi:hypothetical protein